MNFGLPELILIALVIQALIGAKKVPEFAQGLGKGIKEFRKAMKDVQEEVEHGVSKKNEDKK